MIRRHVVTIACALLAIVAGAVLDLARLPGAA